MNLEARWNTYTLQEKDYLETYLKRLFSTPTSNREYEKSSIELSAISRFHFATIDRKESYYSDS